MASRVDPSALRAARERMGLTQHELARRVGAAGGERISRWELGTSEPRPSFLLQLASVLDLDPGELLALEGEVPDLRALRFEAGCSVPEVAVSVRVSKAAYQRWEAGQWRRLPGGSTLAALAATFDVSASNVSAAFDEARRLADPPE